MAGGVKFIAKQFKPNEPAAQFAPQGGLPRAARINVDKSRWIDPRDYNLHWDGGWLQLGRALGDGVSTALRVSIPVFVTNVIAEIFGLEPSPDGSPNVGRCVVSQGRDGVPVVSGGDGLVEIGGDGTAAPSPLQEQCFSEGPPLPVTVAPATTLTGATTAAALLGQSLTASATTLPVASSAGFAVGDLVAIGAGSDHVELAVVVSLDPFTIDRPLRAPHAAGEVVQYLMGDASLPGDAPAIVPLVPARVLETRQGANDRTVDGLFQGEGRVVAGGVVELTVADRGGVAADASAVMLNVTAVGPDAAGFGTVWPCGAERPLASNVNYGPGDVAPNAVLAKVGSGGKVCLFTKAGTDLVVDVNGYVLAG